MSTGWKLDKNVNLADAGALLVGFIALGFSLFNFWFAVGRKPRLIELPPRQVIILSQHYPARNIDVARFAANRQYVSERQFGASAVVTEEFLQINLRGERYGYVWQTIGNFKPDGEALRQEDGRSPTAAVVKAGEAVGHEIFYAAATSEDVLEWSTFLTSLAQVGEMDLEFVAVVHGQQAITHSCRVTATPALIKVLETRMWAAPPCVASDH